MSGAAELLVTLEVAGVMVTLNASEDGLKLNAATPPPAELLAQIRAAKTELLEYLAAQRQTVAQKTYPDWALIGAQTGHCGSCARWTQAADWGPFMGLCAAPSAAFWPESAPLAIHAGHRCAVTTGTGYRAKIGGQTPPLSIHSPSGAGGAA